MKWQRDNGTLELLSKMQSPAGFGLTMSWIVIAFQFVCKVTTIEAFSSSLHSNCGLATHAANQANWAAQQCDIYQTWETKPYKVIWPISGRAAWRQESCLQHQFHLFQVSNSGCCVTSQYDSFIPTQPLIVSTLVSTWCNVMSILLFCLIQEKWEKADSDSTLLLLHIELSTSTRTTNRQTCLLPLSTLQMNCTIFVMAQQVSSSGHVIM